MHTELEIFRVANAMARHAGARQAVVARNIANADTPGYKAMDIAPFQSMVSNEFQVSGPRDISGLRATRPGHIDFARREGTADFTARPATDVTGKPNGNTVSLEQEMLHGVEVKRQHDRAVAIYKSSLTIMRAAIGRR